MCFLSPLLLTPKSMTVDHLSCYQLAYKQKSICGPDGPSHHSLSGNGSHVLRMTTSIWHSHVTMKSRTIKRAINISILTEVESPDFFPNPRKIQNCNLIFFNIFFNSRTRPTPWYVTYLLNLILTQVISFVLMSEGLVETQCHLLVSFGTIFQRTNIDVRPWWISANIQPWFLNLLNH